MNLLIAIAGGQPWVPIIGSFCVASAGLNPRVDWLHAQRGRISRAQGDLPAALDQLGTAIRISPNEPDSFIERRNLYIEKGDYGRTIAD
jgi:hypothetical protein